MFLWHILILLCIIIHYIVEKTFFVAIVCKLLALKNLKCQAKDCFKVNGKIITKMPKKGEFVRFKNYERKIKSSFTIYPYF